MIDYINIKDEWMPIIKKLENKIFSTYPEVRIDFIAWYEDIAKLEMGYRAGRSLEYHLRGEYISQCLDEATAQIRAMTQNYLNIPKFYKDKNNIILTCYEVPKGWEELVDEMIDEISSYLWSVNELYTFSIGQIKEKFGELRVYYMLSVNDEELYKDCNVIIEKYADKARYTCGICGKSSTLSFQDIPICQSCMNILGET